MKLKLKMISKRHLPERKTMSRRSFDKCQVLLVIIILLLCKIIADIQDQNAQQQNRILPVNSAGKYVTTHFALYIASGQSS